ncbi:helix-turn-helix domain-containing protein [Shinella sumterensis]|uniref:MerR family transcriptional regulator n=1 Tax=Rhizobium subbaraonis TaxID=908946 RepID=A0A285USE5_9HYPH|nr:MULTISPECIES: helix-turn-helix domain-containing protein [Rhizobiaceae]MCW5711735.1 helix-turn-helix domain-containing protein [Shinella sp.]WLS08780.1 helix-turn-helix domain-containing protein [Shinella sumterensis]SOC44835.1 MerR family transcriptional regulator [Rhizobium subbaraonis]
MLTIGDLSRVTGVKIPTIRYYEQMGLMAEAERSEGNQRRYGTHDRDRLSFIKHARDLGFTIEAIRELLALNAHPESLCANAHHIANRQLQQVRDKIQKLRLLERELDRISAGCEGDQIKDCYVIESLANHRLCCSDH